MQCPQEYVGVRGTAAEKVPEHAGHAPGSVSLLLFVRGHVQDAPPRKTRLLDHAPERKDEFADAIVGADIAAEWGVVIPEIVSAYSMEYGRLGGGLGRPVGCADAVLEKSRRSTVAD